MSLMSVYSGTQPSRFFSFVASATRRGGVAGAARLERAGDGLAGDRLAGGDDVHLFILG